MDTVTSFGRNMKNVGPDHRDFISFVCPNFNSKLRYLRAK